LAPSAQPTPTEIVIRDLDGKTSTVALDRDRITLGRSSANELCYPDDVGLSRQHLALIRRNSQWTVEDLGSKNGTMLNGQRLEGPMPFNPGDRIAAGHLTIEFADAGLSTQNTVVFVDSPEQFSKSATTVVASLDGVLAPQADELNKTYKRLKANFNDASAFIAAVPLYAGGFMAFGWGTDDTAKRHVPLGQLEARFKEAGIDTQYYTPAVHVGAFSLPPFIGKLLS